MYKACRDGVSDLVEIGEDLLLVTGISKDLFVNFDPFQLGGR